jgi:NADP-dependent 3-hydroxy acid dehydrogenase YdfG
MKRDCFIGKNALITGGTSGIGLAIAKKLSLLGANVMIFGRTKSHLREAIYEIKPTGGQVVGVLADVSDQLEIDGVFDKIDSLFGKIDIFINNAALPARRVVSANYQEIEKVLNVNILGYLYCASKAIRRMKKNGSGHIVNIGSMSAKVKEENADLYVATKSAIEGFSEALRKQANRAGIKISLIEPGSVGTNMVSENFEEQSKMQTDLTMLKAEDIAEAVLFCLTRPERCDIMNIQIKPHKQII